MRPLDGNGTALSGAEDSVASLPTLLRLAPGVRWTAGPAPVGILVLDGEVEWSLDVVDTTGPQPLFRRQFIAGASGGSFALAVGAEGCGFSMVATEAATVRILSEADSAVLLAEGSDRMPEAVEAWVQTLARLAGHPVPEDAAPPPALDGTAPGGAALMPPAGVLWLTAGGVAGQLPGGTPAAALPVAPGVWARFPQDAIVTARTTAAMPPQGAAMVAGLLALFQDAALAVASRAAREEARSLARTQALRQAEQARVSGSIGRMAALLGHEPEAMAAGAGPAGALAMLERLGLPAHSIAALPGEDAVAQAKRCLEAAGARWREVTLDPGWWHSGGEDMVVFTAARDRSFALQPRLSGGFQLFAAPGTHARRLRRAEAERLAPVALAVHAPLAGDHWSAPSLVAYGLRGIPLPWLGFACLMLLSGLAALFAPIATGWVMEPIIPTADRRQLIVVIGLMLAATLIGTLVQTAQSMLALRLEGLLDNRVQSAIWDRLLRLPAPFFRGFSVGDMASRATAVNQMRQLLSGAALSGLMHGVSGLLSLGLMLYHSWRLTLAGTLLALIFVGAVHIIGRRVVRTSREMLELAGRQQGLVMQIISGINRIRLSAAQRRVFALWAEQQARLTARTMDQQRLGNMASAISAAMPALSLGCLVLVLGWQADILLAPFETPQDWSDVSGARLFATFPPDVFVTFHVAYGQFIGALTGLAGTALQLLRIGPLYGRMAPIIEQREESEPAAAGGMLAEPLRGGVEFAHVNFRYAPERPLVLQDVSFHLRPGEFVAIVGPSGAGKSSLVRLLLGFDRPESGSILLDGRDLAGLPLRAVRRQMGVVLQDGRVMAGSILQNIAMGMPLSEAEAWEAAEQAGIAEEIRAMPMQFETFLNEGGTVLSGGQRQRLMIARALARRPRLLIMDEATSALDNRTQARVSETIRGLRVSRIVIAHRLSTIEGADRIIVLEAGRVVEEGRFDELMARDGTFAALARRQLAH